MSNPALTPLLENLSQVIKGKEDVVKFTVIALLSEGHLLLEDVPGVGKTTLAKALARSVTCSFKRIQFTPDLLPSDVTGASIYNQQTHEFEFMPGPAFANIVLADEINRATPRTQSALLEVMNEYQITVDSITHQVPRPFMVIATQNPVDYQGTFPLPESQLDRFLVRIEMGYPDPAMEREILLSQRLSIPLDSLEPVVNREALLQMQGSVRKVRVEPVLVQYMVALGQATRLHAKVALGVSPRGLLALQRAAQGHAWFEGRDHCLPDDIKAVAPAVVCHRMFLHPHHEAPGVVGQVVKEILETTAVPM